MNEKGKRMEKAKNEIKGTKSQKVMKPQCKQGKSMRTTEKRTKNGTKSGKGKKNRLY